MLLLSTIKAPLMILLRPSNEETRTSRTGCTSLTSDTPFLFDPRLHRKAEPHSIKDPGNTPPQAANAPKCDLPNTHGD